MTVKSSEELDGLRKIGAIVAEARDLMRDSVRPGMTTMELDDIGARFMTARGARSSPQMVYSFPGYSCISVNDEVVHGVPCDRRIAPGDLVKVDVTAELEGFVADSAITVLVPPERQQGKRLLACARAAFQRAMKYARAGNRLNLIGRAVENETRIRGFAVVRELCGHGVGRSIHEAPEVSNFYEPRDPTILTEGLVIAVEPILSERPSRLVKEDDGWTLRTHNRCLAVHYEHTIVITRDKPIIITAA